MKLPPAAALLRHRGPAILLDAVCSFTGRALSATARGSGPWEWPQILEGAAQCAGLLAGLQGAGMSEHAVVAEFRNVSVGALCHAGPIRFDARLDRKLLHFWRCTVEARGLDGSVLLYGDVTLAPGARAANEEGSG